MTPLWQTAYYGGIPVVLAWIIYILTNKQKYKRNVENLKGKVVLITGASAGIGEALAHAFYERGCKLILSSRRKEELERVKNDLLNTQLKKTTFPPIIFPMDVTDLEAIPEHVAHILNLVGHIDILINNAGLYYRGEVIDTSNNVDMKLMMVNFFGTVALTKAILPSMLARKKGQIVMLSSAQGRFAIPRRAPYGAAKHALQAYSDSLRAELSDTGVKVTVISPGYIATDLDLNALTSSATPWGEKDSEMSKGYSPQYCAEEILKATVCQKNERVIAPIEVKTAIYLRTLCPNLFFFIMAMRFRDKNIY